MLSDRDQMLEIGNEYKEISSSIKKFRIIVSTLWSLAGLHKIEDMPQTELEKISISLYDQWLNSKSLENLDMPDILVLDKNDDVDRRLKYLIAALGTLDPNKRITPLIMEHTLESDDDFEIKMAEFLPKQRLDGTQASIYRIITICTLALGIAFQDAGNTKLGFHLVSLASTIQERVNRTSARAVTDEQVIRILYYKQAELGIKLEDYDQAIEAGTKLVSRWDVVLSRLLNKEITVQEFNFEEYFRSLGLLMGAGEASKRYESAVYALQKVMHIFSVDNRLMSENGQEVSSLDFIAKKGDQAELYQKETCLRLIEANENANGDPFISLEFARSALEHFSLVKIVANDAHHEEITLKFMLARAVYKAALSLAGGLEHASSPPIAILSPGINSPTIKGLLEESLDILEEIHGLAQPGKESENCKEAIEIQIAIVAMELRQEERAKSILSSQSIYSSTLGSWQATKQQVNSGKSTSFDYLKSVIYSTEVFKRLQISVAPSLSRMTSKLTLSRKQAAKVQCTYCSMQARSALKCEDCAEVNRFVWYCSEECLQDDMASHLNTTCARQAVDSSFKVEPSVMDFSSILQSWR